MSATPWSLGRFGACGARTLLFDRMFEDSRVEADAFRPGSRVLCVASAGCIALHLASLGHEVTAIDVNDRQIAHVRARCRGDAAVAGRADALLAIGRAALSRLGWRRDRLEEFLALDRPAAQVRRWLSEFDPGLRTALALTLRPLLAVGYAPWFRRATPDGFATVLRRRLARCFASHPNRGNQLARLLLLGEAPRLAPPATPPTLVVAEAVAYLEAAPRHSLDAASLSNIADGAPRAWRRRLAGALRGAFRGDGVVVLRTFAEPRSPAEARLAARDRSGIWGAIIAGTPAQVAERLDG